MPSPAEVAFGDLAAHESGDVLPFYEVEGQVLALWDRLNELKLEKAIIEAQTTWTSGEQSLTDEETKSQLKAAEKDCLEARATYMLQQSVVEDVLITDPVLKAVHSGANTTSTEMALHPLLDRRDTLSIAHVNLTSSLQAILRKKSKSEADGLKTMQENLALASKVLSLANELRSQHETAVTDSRVSAQLNKLRDDTTTTKKRWRIMKSVVAAVIAGSGVNWAGDDTLRDLVLDDESGVDKNNSSL